MSEQTDKVNQLLTEKGVLPVDSKKVAPKKKATPSKKAPPKNENESGRPDLDPSKKVQEEGIYWLNGSGSFFVRRDTDGRIRFLELGSAEMRRKLKVKGFRTKPDLEAGERCSEVDRILDVATEERAVDFATNIAGMSAGVYDLQGGRVLIRESPRLIEPEPGPPEPGKFKTIHELIYGLLGREGAQYFIAWLSVAFVALRNGQRRQGQCLIIVGPPGCGKSRLQHQIITPILGGRNADPKSFFFGRTDFNAELIGAEHLLIEEVPSSNRHEDRQYFGERMKEVVANDTTRLHKKNRDALTVSPFWRLSITLNDNPEKLRCLPPMVKDFAEKIIMIEAKSCPEFWQKFASEEDPRLAFRTAITSELPAFVNFLSSVEIPENLKHQRYGIRSYVPDELAETLFESEPEHHLLLLIEKALWKDNDETTFREPWIGDAEELKQLLTAESSPVRASATRLLSAYPTACGQYLARLNERFPGRIRPKRSNRKRNWIITPPEESTEI